MELGIDIGFSYNKYATGLETFGRFPNALAEIRGNQITAGEDIYEMEGRYYYIGDKAIKQPQENIIEIDTHELMEKFAPIFIAHTSNELGVDPKEVTHIGVGVSPAFMNRIASFRERCSNFVVNGIHYEFNVSVTPQGLGAFRTLEQRKEVVDNDILLVDGGFNTVDVLFVYDKEAQTGRISSDNSFEKLGVIRIAQKLKEIIKRDYGIDKNIKEAQFILNDRKFKHRGEMFDLSERIDGLIDEYTAELMNEINVRYGSDIDKLDSVYIVGGVAYLINPNIQGYPKGFIKTFKDSEYLNAIGNFIIAQKINKKNSKEKK